MNILVTGGAGYIGSFMTKRLLNDGNSVTVIDNLESGHAEAVDERAQFRDLDIRDKENLIQLFSQTKFDGVFHFAGLISVEESEKDPKKYNENNVVGSKTLFSVASEIGKVDKFIFSSTAAIYGNPLKIPIPEDHPKNPTSEYGKTKLEIEKYLESLRTKDLSKSYVSLRYFNACGAALDGSIGEMHDPETHIIPLAMRSILDGNEFNLYGTNYDTKDGSCIRDYIHVLDLVEAHIMAYEKMINSKGGYKYNVGTGRGYSNKEVISMIEKVSNQKIKLFEKDRRKGDSSRLVADSSRIQSELGYSPAYSDLRTIIKTAWEWHKKN